MILYDPQTSGGLLIAAPVGEIAAIAIRLAELGYNLPCAIIGEVLDGPEGKIIIER